MLVACVAVLAAYLVSRVTGDTGAYFTDVRNGAITGTYAASGPAVPAVELGPGSSKRLHASHGGDKGSPDPIAFIDPAGQLTLDFGDALPGHGDTRPDVVRMASRFADDRVLLMYVTGPAAEMVEVSGFGGGAEPTVLRAGVAERVGFRVRVPDSAIPGAYTGALVVHVQGCDDDIRIPLVIRVAGATLDPKRASAAQSDPVFSDGSAQLETSSTPAPESQADPDTDGRFSDPTATNRSIGSTSTAASDETGIPLPQTPEGQEHLDVSL